MAIPEAQLQTWSNQGAVATAKATHESVRNALSQATALSGRSFDVFLQGSYKNDTNIRGDSDVDIVVRLNSTFHYDLSLLDAAQQARWAEAYSTRATYVWEHFRGDVLAALVAYYGAGSVNPGRNAVTIAAGGGRLSADVVVATQYYLYTSFWGVNQQQSADGIAFYSQPDNRLVINYPLPHYDNGVAKNSVARTNGWYKPSVRMIKNARTRLVEDGDLDEADAPSYFVECLIYNVPDSMFGTAYANTYYNVVKWLRGQNVSGFVCQNGVLGLFGPAREQWSPASASTFLQALASQWDNW